MKDEPKNDEETPPATSEATPPKVASKPPLSWKDLKETDGESFKRL